MAQINAIFSLIEKLNNRIEPLSVDQCKKMAEWLNTFVLEHDEKIWQETLLTVERETHGTA